MCVCCRVNACTCAWRAWTRQQSPKGGIYLKRASSHDLAWSLPIILLWGLYICICLCACSCVCVCVHAQCWGFASPTKHLLPLSFGSRTTLPLLIALIWLTAWSSYQPSSSWPARSKYLQKNLICHGTTEGKRPSLHRTPTKCCLTPSLPVCLLFVSAARPALLWTQLEVDSLTNCHSNNLISSGRNLSHYPSEKKKPSNICPWNLIFTEWSDSFCVSSKGSWFETKSYMPSGRTHLKPLVIKACPDWTLLPFWPCEDH